VTVWGALAGGAVGSIVFSVGLELSQAMGWTRMDIPLLLGTVVTDSRDRARAIGYAIHLASGLCFALVYAAVFAAVGHAGWELGLALGAVHAGFFGGPLMNVLLPLIHPRMGKPWTDAAETPLLEPAGFMLVNYGASTVVVSTVLHLAFGAIVGAFAAGVV
jgi:hypothetical protein